jgi:hypothetical protein
MAGTTRLKYAPNTCAPQRLSRPHDVERHDAPAACGHAAHLGQPALEVLQIAQEEGRHHTGERAVAERQRERVGGQELHVRHTPLAKLGLADLQHALGEVGAGDEATRRPRANGDCEIGGARRQVEYGPAGHAGDGSGDPPAPGVMQAGGHERVHEVVAPGDAREHRTHDVGLRRREPRCRHYRRPSTTAASTISAM